MRVLSYSSSTKSDVLAALSRPKQDWVAYREKVRPIIAAVRQEGDAAVRRFTEQFDGVAPAFLAVPREELSRAAALLPRNLRKSLETACENILRFHQGGGLLPRTVETQPGVLCRREVRAIPSVGLYVPGGETPLVSTLLMLGIPARLAGVERIVLCTPPGKNGAIASSILAACELLGIQEVFAIGGAQAIAALAYGTESVPKVAKIVGPGNVYVSAAKAEVSIDPAGAAIDMLAGPSELMVLADGSARPAFIAADLLSQAEHDSLAQVVLVSTSAELVAAVEAEIASQSEFLPRRRIATAVMEESPAIIVGTLAEAAEIADYYAPEHLSIQTERPEAVLAEIRNAGSVFLGPYSPEAVGDYTSGTNHVLPTSAAAQACSGIGVGTFQKFIFVQELSLQGLSRLREATVTLARAEGLEAHARAVDIRFSLLP